MRKFMLITLCTILCLTFSLPVNAQEARRPVGEGYTPEGIHYTVYPADTTKGLTFSVAASIYVSRDFDFDSNIFPPREIIYTEKINGISYTGTLTRFSVSIIGGQVIGNYRGTLYQVRTYSN